MWDYILRDGTYPETSIPRETLEKLKREFNYWYPVDLRVSGKDLIQNHLTFFLYTHCAMFPPVCTSELDILERVNISAASMACIHSHKWARTVGWCKNVEVSRKFPHTSRYNR